MDRPSPTGVCSNAALQEEISCPNVAVAAFYGTMEQQIWLGNTLLLGCAAITGVMVGIDSYCRRFRHHHFTRFIFLGANTLFLPIISYVISTLRDSSNDYVNGAGGGATLSALCHSVFHPCMVITWAFLVQMAALSTVSVVATDRREGGKIGPPWVLLVKGIWILYLGSGITNGRFFDVLFWFSTSKNNGPVTIICSKIMFAPFAILCAKIWLKWYSFKKARKSFALGRSPGLVFGYMQMQQQQQLQQEGRSQQHGEDAPCPPLLFMGEDSRQVVRRPWGYEFSDVWTNTGLVTLDRIWKLDSMHPTSTPRLKDLCLSFALFKLLRSRLARYDVSNSAGTIGFFRSLLLQKDDGEPERMFRVVSDELSFVHEYYYSSLPISYAKWWLPLLSILISLLGIGYCIVAAYFSVVLAARTHNKRGKGQITCSFWCSKPHSVTREPLRKEFGNLFFDVLPEFVLIVLVLIVEVRDMAFYICSNWTKVAIIYHSASALQHQHGVVHRLVVDCLLRCRCSIMNRWDAGKIGQCSVLVLHPTAITTTILRGLTRMFHLPDVKSKAKVPDAVKFCILDALRSAATATATASGSGFQLQCQLAGNFRAPLQRNQAGRSLLWACNDSRSTSEIILTWHVATSILEFRHPAAHLHENTEHQDSSPANQHKTAAIHLSGYCAYLMTWCPELLPDEEAWCKSLYRAVKKDAERVLAGRVMQGQGGPSMPEPDTEYKELVRLLSDGSVHRVLKNGVRLGEQLLQLLVEGEETAWAILAGFWAEMILFVAPSSNLEAHRRAIARGGELITLLWALLFHAGIVSRPGGEAGGAATAGNGAV